MKTYIHMMDPMISCGCQNGTHVQAIAESAVATLEELSWRPSPGIHVVRNIAGL